MVIYKLANHVEMNIWKVIISGMEKEGIIMKFTGWFFRFIHTKFGYLLLLISIWGAVGFISGLLIGRIMSLL